MEGDKDEQSSSLEVDFSKIDEWEKANAKPVLSANLKEIIEECRSVIKEFDLARLLEEVRIKSIKSLNEDDHEMFCAGMIKLGEALTYCKNRELNKAVAASGISWYARDYADVRDYFVHHYMYDHLLNLHDKLKDKVKILSFIDVLSTKLTDLEEKGTDFPLLLKEVDKGKNKFDFEYPHFIVCLKNEFDRLNQAMEKVVDEKSISEAQKVFLDNRIRNILSIMVDLLDTEGTSTNKQKFCVKEKKVVADFNAQFMKKNEQYGVFFNKLKLYRNALCHIDGNVAKPYRDENKASLVTFIRELQGLHKDRYIESLEEQLLALRKEVKGVGQPTVVNLAESPLSPLESESGAQKKVKVVKSKISEGFEKFKSAYGTVEKKEGEPAKQKDSEKIAAPPDPERLRKVSSSSSIHLKK